MPLPGAGREKESVKKSPPFRFGTAETCVLSRSQQFPAHSPRLLRSMTSFCMASVSVTK